MKNLIFDKFTVLLADSCISLLFCNNNNSLQALDRPWIFTVLTKLQVRDFTSLRRLKLLRQARFIAIFSFDVEAYGRLNLICSRVNRLRTTEASTQDRTSAFLVCPRLSTVVITIACNSYQLNTLSVSVQKPLKYTIA